MAGGQGFRGLRDRSMGFEVSAQLPTGADKSKYLSTTEESKHRKLRVQLKLAWGGAAWASTLLKVDVYLKEKLRPTLQLFKVRKLTASCRRGALCHVSWKCCMTHACIRNTAAAVQMIMTGVRMGACQSRLMMEVPIPSILYVSWLMTHDDIDQLLLMFSKQNTTI